MKNIVVCLNGLNAVFVCMALEFYIGVMRKPFYSINGNPAICVFIMQRGEAADFTAAD